MLALVFRQSPTAKELAVNRTGLPILLLAFVAAAGAACGGSDPPAQNPNAQYAGGYGSAYPQQPGAYPQQPGAYPQQPGGYPQQPGAQPGYPQQPGTQPGYPQPGAPGTAPPAGSAPGGLQIPGLPAPGGAPAGGASGGTAQALDPNVAALATGPLTLFANSEAPGMQKEGPIVAGNFQEGQTLESTFQFQPGKCYTLVGSAVGIQRLELEMQYVTPLPGLAPSIGKSSQTGAQASIGRQNGCLKPLSPFPAQAKFIVRAAKGAGMAAAQLYAK